MNLLKQFEIIEFIKNLKLKKDFSKSPLGKLRKQIFFNGIAEFKFRNYQFYMLNIQADDNVVLKYLWRDKYENMTLNLWYEITREQGFCLDIGAHTGIYSIIGSLNKKLPLTISIEPYYLNYARLLNNLKLNNLSVQFCHLAAVSHQNGTLKFESSLNSHHSTGGKISDKGMLSVRSLMIDSLKFTKKVTAIKIDTEGHEYNVLKGAQNTIQNYKPDIIFEISKESFKSCKQLLQKFGYKFFFINEEKKKFTEIDDYDDSFKIKAGVDSANCYATVKGISSKQTILKLSYDI